MEQKKVLETVGKSFPRKDGVARVTGREVYTCGDGGSLSGRRRCSSVACENTGGVLDVRYVVACRNALFDRIPGSTEARHA